MKKDEKALYWRKLRAKGHPEKVLGSGHKGDGRLTWRSCQQGPPPSQNLILSPWGQSPELGQKGWVLCNSVPRCLAWTQLTDQGQQDIPTLAGAWGESRWPQGTVCSCQHHSDFLSTNYNGQAPGLGRASGSSQHQPCPQGADGLPGGSTDDLFLPQL